MLAKHRTRCNNSYNLNKGVKQMQTIATVTHALRHFDVSVAQVNNQLTVTTHSNNVAVLENEIELLSLADANINALSINIVKG